MRSLLTLISVAMIGITVLCSTPHSLHTCFDPCLYSTLYRSHWEGSQALSLLCCRSTRETDMKKRVQVICYSQYLKTHNLKIAILASTMPVRAHNLTESVDSHSPNTVLSSAAWPVSWCIYGVVPMGKPFSQMWYQCVCTGQVM